MTLYCCMWRCCVIMVWIIKFYAGRNYEHFTIKSTCCSVVLFPACLLLIWCDFGKLSFSVAPLLRERTRLVSHTNLYNSNRCNTTPLHATTQRSHSSRKFLYSSCTICVPPSHYLACHATLLLKIKEAKMMDTNNNNGCGGGRRRRC